MNRKAQKAKVLSINLAKDGFRLNSLLINLLFSSSPRLISQGFRVIFLKTQAQDLRKYLLYSGKNPKIGKSIKNITKARIQSII